MKKFIAMLLCLVMVLSLAPMCFAADDVNEDITGDVMIYTSMYQFVIDMMDAKLAAKIICDGQGADAIDACAKDYAALQNHVTSAARRGYVDQIIEAADTRKYVIGAFEMLFTKREDGPVRKHGTV